MSQTFVFSDVLNILNPGLLTVEHEEISKKQNLACKCFKKRKEKKERKTNSQRIYVLHSKNIQLTAQRVLSSTNILPIHYYYVLSTVISPLHTLSLLILQQTLEGSTIIIITSILQMRKYFIYNRGQISKFTNCMP